MLTGYQGGVIDDDEEAVIERLNVSIKQVACKFGWEPFDDLSSVLLRVSYVARYSESHGRSSSICQVERESAIQVIEDLYGLSN